MTVQTDFVALVNPIFDGRVYPKGAEDSPAPPYATFFRVVAVEDPTLDQNGGTGNATNTRLQADVYALSYAEAQEKASAVKSALKGWGVDNILLGEQDMYEPDTKLHSVMLDISTWHQ